MIKPYIGDKWQEKAFTFEGETKIRFVCAKPTDVIVFHGKDINIDESKLSLKTEGGIDVVLKGKLEYDEIREFYKLSLTNECTLNEKYILTIDYVGKISTNLYGFYRSSYVDENGVTQ